MKKGTDDIIFPLRVCANKTMSPNIHQQKGVKGLKTKTVVRDLYYYQHDVRRTDI